MIDTNIYLSRWPCRRLPADETDRLADTLRAAGITRAWAGSFDALLHKDIAGVNERLLMECARHPDLFVAFAAVNPMLPDWRDDVARCSAQPAVRGVRLHPNYHGYGLDDPRFVELLVLAAERRLVVQLAVRMEDERTQHPLLRVPAIDLAPLAELLRTKPGVQVELLNGGRDLTPARLSELAECPGVWIEPAMTEGVGGIAALVGRFPFERIVLGSYAPFFYVESALRKLEESELGGEIVARIARRNAESLLAAAARTAA